MLQTTKIGPYYTYIGATNPTFLDVAAKGTEPNQTPTRTSSKKEQNNAPGTTDIKTTSTYAQYQINLQNLGTLQDTNKKLTSENNDLLLRISHLEKTEKENQELQATIKKLEEKLVNQPKKSDLIASLKGTAEKIAGLKDDLLQQKPSDDLQKAQCIISPLDTCKKQLTEISEFLEKNEPNVEMVLSRLGPVKCANETKGPKRTECRNEIIKIWCELAHTKYKLDLQCKHLSKKEQLLPTMDILLTQLQEQVKILENYRETSPTLEWGIGITGQYQQVKKDKLETFFDDLCKLDIKFTELHNRVLECEKELKVLVTQFKSLAPNPEYLKELGRGNAERINQNVQLFAASTSSIENEERNLYKNVIEKWNVIREVHLNLRSQLGQFKGAAESAHNVFPWAIQVKLTDDTALSYIPPATY